MYPVLKIKLTANRIYKIKCIIFTLLICLNLPVSAKSAPSPHSEPVRQETNTNISTLNNLITDIVKSNEYSYSTRIDPVIKIIRNLFPDDNTVKISQTAFRHNPMHILNYDDIIKKSLDEEKNLLHIEKNKNFMYKFGTNFEKIKQPSDSNNSFSTSFITFFDEGKFVTKRFTVPYAYINEPEKNSDIYWKYYDIFFYLKDMLSLSKYRYIQKNSDIMPKINKKSITADYLYIGNHDAGKIFQDKGTHTVNGSVYLGFYPGSEGLFLLSEGYFYADQIVLGYLGAGSIFQISGSITVERVLYLGLNESSKSLYSLTGGFIKSDALIGVKGTGKFNHVYGTFNSNWISVGFAEGTGIYKMCSGELNSYMLSIGHGANIWQAGKDEFTGWKSGTGLFEQSGGISNIDTLSIGVWHSRGTYNLRHEAVLNSYFVYVGNHNGRGEFIHDSGIHKSNSITIGHAGGVGVYEINSGWLQTNTIVVGHFTNSSIQTVNGYFIHNNGKIENSGEEGILWLTIGHKSGNGKYLMNNGRLHSKTTHIGFAGSGVFTHNGGDHFSEYLDIGLDHGEGIYILAGGHLRSYSQFIGKKGKGIFIHYQGSNYTENLHIGCEQGNGTYKLFNGKLTAVNVEIGCKNSTGFLEIQSPEAELIVEAGYILFEKTANFQAVKGSSIILKNASFIADIDSEKIFAGTRNINLSFELEENKIELYNESGGTKSFFINSIEIKNAGTNLLLHKLSNIDFKIKTLIIDKNASIDLNGNNIYCEEVINNGGQINLNGGQIISASY